MSPYSSNTSSSNPDIQQQYAQQQAEQRRATQQQAEQQRAAQNPPVGAPPEQAPRMVQRNRQQQDAVRDEMDIDTGDDDVRAPKRKREEEGELMEGEDRAAKKIRLDPPPEVGQDVRLVTRGDMAMPVPAIPAVPVTLKSLIKAIKSNDLETVKSVLATRQINLDAIFHKHKRVLMVAAEYGHTEMVSLLLDYGADIDGSNFRHETALIYAAKNGRDEIFNLLIEKRVDIHAADEKGNTALTYAVKNGNVAMVKQLLTLGADINAFNNKGQSALMLTAALGHEKMFALLLENVADIYARDHHRLTALMYAIKGGSETILDTLVTRGVDINARNDFGDTALNHAIGWGRVEMLRLLLALRVNVNTADNDDETPLMQAVGSGEAEMFRLLFDAGADISSVDNNGQTVMMHAVMGGNVWVVKKLLDVAPDIDAVDHDGRTALMLAAKYNKLDILKLLLEHGVQVNLRGTQVKNATVRAIERKNIPVLELLLDYGGEPYDLQGSPPLLVSDMLMHRALLKREVVAPPLTLESLNDISTSVPPELSANRAVHEELAQIFEGLQICSPITIEFNKQLFDSGKQMQALAGTGSPLSQAQKSIAIAGLLASLEGWVKSWTPGLTIYRGKGLSAQAEAKLTALVKLQVEKLVALGEQMEMTLAAGLETLMPQCAQYTQLKNGELVVDDVGLMAHLTGQLGLYGPLADQVAAAWFTTVNQQQAIIRASSLFQSGFDEQASESEAGQALLTAFGQALKQIDDVQAGSLLQTSTLKEQQAGLYADLMFRQLHMLMQYADQARAAS